MYGVNNDPSGMLHQNAMGPVDPKVSYHSARHTEDPPEDDMHKSKFNQDDAKSDCSGTSSMMKGAQDILKKNRMKRM